MRFLLITLIFFLGQVSYAQVEENTPEPASNSILNNLSSDSLKYKEANEEESADGDKEAPLLEQIIIKETSDKRSRQKVEDKKEYSKKRDDFDDLKSNSKLRSKGFQDANDKLYLNKKVSRQQSFQRNPTIEQQTEMYKANDIIEKEDPNSFEYNLNRYVIENYNTENYSNLKSAEIINSNSTELIRQMAAHNIIIDNKDESKFYLNKLKEKGELDEMSLKYCEDLLESAPINGTLITHGMIDSYGTHLNQISKHQREDVQIINLDFLQSDSYQKELDSKGYIIPDSKNIDVSFVQEFCEKNEAKNLALSLTIPKNYFMPIQSQLYVSGLVFEYHLNNSPENLIDKNIFFWNKKMNMAVLNSKNASSNKLASNYLPMLLNLRRHFKSQGNNKEVIRINKQINSISQKCGKTKQIKKLKSSY